MLNNEERATIHRNAEREFAWGTLAVALLLVLVAAPLAVLEVWEPVLGLAPFVAILGAFAAVLFVRAR